MSTQVWSGGANDGIFLTAGNWVSGVAPVNSDTAIIGATNQTIHGAATGLTGVTVKFTAGFGGIVGDDAALTFASAALIEYSGTGASANLGCAGTVTAANFYHTGSNVTLSSGTWATLTNSAGPLTVAAATVVTTFRNITGTVSVGYNATAITTFTSSGPVMCKRNITTANVKMGGVLIHQDNGTANYTLCTTANIEGGGTYNKQSGGTDTTINAFPYSRFTIAGSSGGAAGTVTATDLMIWATASVVDAVPGVVLTVTNGKTYVGQVSVAGGTGVTIPR